MGDRRLKFTKNNLKSPKNCYVDSTRHFHFLYYNVFIITVQISGEWLIINYLIMLFCSYRRRAKQAQNWRSGSWKRWRAGNSIRSSRSDSCWLPKSNGSVTWNSTTPSTIRWRRSTSGSAASVTVSRLRNKSSASSGRSEVKWTRPNSTTPHSVSITIYIYCIA